MQVEEALCVMWSPFVFRVIEGKTEEEKRNREGGRKITLLTCEQKQKSLYVMAGGRERFD